MDMNPLSTEQVQQFIHDGYIHLSKCFDVSPGSLAHRWVEETWQRNGLDKHDSAGWPGKIHMPSTEHVAVETFAPKAAAAIYQLCGGRERIHTDDFSWSNAFIANYKLGIEEPWQEPSADVHGWHKDGDFFTHFLDSPEQALLTIIVFSDIEPRGGGTFIAPDSIKPVAEYLNTHRQGLDPNFSMHERLIDQCSEFMEVTGRAGDVILMHPYMLHASSANHSGKVRLIINPCCTFKEPMQFSREDKRYSAVERAVLHALDVDSLDYAIEGERRSLTPERHKHQQKLLELEQQRKT